jgi:hypothetical protein
MTGDLPAAINRGNQMARPAHHQGKSAPIQHPMYDAPEDVPRGGKMNQTETFSFEREVLHEVTAEELASEDLLLVNGGLEASGLCCMLGISVADSVTCPTGVCCCGCGENAPCCSCT